ncbi:MAG: radical SAM protein, partial [candidate division WOR-3 bacterium]
ADEGGIRSAAVLTTGCRLNQAESDALRRRLQAQGVVLSVHPEQADACFLNTCAVTAAAGRSSVQQVLRICRLRPKPRVVVMGCLAEYDPVRLAGIDGVDEVWDNHRKQAEIDGFCPLPRRSRAVLKVQDGCDSRCSYCIVSGLRGRPRSVEPELVCRQVSELVSVGHGEVVLTGLNLGRYKAASGWDLADLLVALLGQSGFRVRLASIEPDGLSERLMEILAEKRICPHFHIPLQSGDDGVLGLMGRGYRTTDYARLVERLVRVRPDACIGADVIAGFPNESDAAFGRTLAFLRELPLAYVHAFSYSTRKGSGAEKLGDPVPAKVKRSRVTALREFSADRSREFRRRFTGSAREAVVESRCSATTDNYLRLELDGCWHYRPGQLVRMFVVEQAGRLVGRPVADAGAR